MFGVLNMKWQLFLYTKYIGCACVDVRQVRSMLVLGTATFAPWTHCGLVQFTFLSHR